MGVNYWELINVFIAVVLLIAIFCNKGNVTMLLALLVYGTLHFSFAVPLVFAGHTKQLAALHLEGSGWLARVSALSLLTCVFYTLSRRAYSGYLSCGADGRKIAHYILITMLVVFSGYLFNLRVDHSLQLKNVVSIEAMLFLLLIGTFAEKSVHDYRQTNIYRWGVAGLIIMSVMVCIVIFEVFFKRSWAVTPESSGDMVYRGSATLFNPNLLGFWGSLVYLACIYALHEFKQNRKLILTGMVLVSFLIYFSGSRGSLLFLLTVLLLSAMMGMMAKGSFRWVSLLIMPITMVSIYCIVSWLIIPFVPNTEGWQEILFLGERFAQTPIYIINYSLLLIDVSFSVPSVPNEISVAIEGRFSGLSADAGWLVLYFDIGWLGLAAIVSLCLMAFWRGVVCYLATRSAFSIFALSALCFCLLHGLVMRYQIFPVWEFIAVIMTPCVLFWAGLNPAQCHPRQGGMPIRNPSEQ